MDHLCRGNGRPARRAFHRLAPEVARLARGSVWRAL